MVDKEFKEGVSRGKQEHVLTESCHQAELRVKHPGNFGPFPRNGSRPLHLLTTTSEVSSRGHSCSPEKWFENFHFC